MKFCYLLACLACLILFACSEDDGPGVTRTPLDWRSDVQFVDATNTPERQIERFVAANNMDTIRTASGLVFQIDNPGTGVKPTVDSTVLMNYKGYLVSGRVFDQSFLESPLNIKLSRLIDAWKEGVPYLGAGGKMWMLVRPSLAYGNNPPQGTGITPESVIVFEIELIEP